MDQVMEAVVADAEVALGKDAFVAAKEEFYLRFGKVFPEDPFYDSRMSYFLDYFMMLRAIPGESRTPFLKFARSNKSVSQDLVSVMECFRHSVFEVQATSTTDFVTVRDILTGITYPVYPKPGESLRGLLKGLVFQGILFPEGDRAWLSNGIVMHPSDTLDVIRDFLKKSSNSSDFDEQDALARLAFVQLRALRHSHAGARRIYRDELRIS